MQQPWSKLVRNSDSRAYLGRFGRASSHRAQHFWCVHETATELIRETFWPSPLAPTASMQEMQEMPSECQTLTPNYATAAAKEQCQP